MKDYNEAKNTPSDINEHLDTLKELAAECSVVTEMGVRAIVSTWAFVEGTRGKFIAIDYKLPSEYGVSIKPIMDRAAERGIEFQFILGDTREMTIEETDLLFIDTNHTYHQLQRELRNHADKARRYIVLHDTTSCPEMLPAVKELTDKGEWKVEKVYENCNGLTVLSRTYGLKKLRGDLLQFSKEKNQWAYTLIGPDGLDNVENLLRTVQKEGIKGDFVETGIWQGGACIYAKAVIDDLKCDRTVFACDSFEGLPKPDVDKYPVDEHDCHFKEDYLRVSTEEVNQNFNSLNVDVNGVVFVKGWFRDTMPILRDKIKEIAVLRLDGDMYESTMVVLENLYEKVPIGGFVIIDDYCLPRAIAATNDFRAQRKIESPLVKVNNCICLWRKLC